MVLSIILLDVKNALQAVLIMGLTGWGLNLLLIIFDSVDMISNERRNYFRIVKEEIKKALEQKKLHCKKIMNGKPMQLEVNESKRKDVIIGCATIAILTLAIYSLYIESNNLAWVLLSYLFGKYMWMDGGIIEGLSSILYYIKRELGTFIVMVIIWLIYYYAIEKNNYNIYSLYLGMAPVFILAFILIYKYIKRKK